MDVPYLAVSDLPDDLDVAGPGGKCVQPLVLADERGPKISSCRVQEPVDRVAREGIVERSRPGCGFRRERGEDQPIQAKDVTHPDGRVTVQHEPAKAMEGRHLPASQRADQDLGSLIDRRPRPSRQALPARLPPDEDVGVEQDAQGLRPSASQASPVP